MSKKVLAIYYTQSGQLEEIVRSFTQPFVDEGVHVEYLRIRPVHDFPFPWTSDRFFDAMPESVLQKPVELLPFPLQHEKYDLIVFAYQPWFLSLSIPSLSALHHPAIRKVMHRCPVVTLIGSRNMWLHSQENLKQILNDIQAPLVGNIALTDRHSNLISAATILHWMLSGRKDRWLGIFPPPGVSPQDIQHGSHFGQTVLKHLQQGNWENLQPTLVAQGAVEIKTLLMFIEERAPRLFSIWAHLIVKQKNRQAWLVAFKYYLLFALFIVAPIILTVYSVLILPLTRSSVSRKKEYYCGIKNKKG